MPPEETQQLDTAVRLSVLNKQDYIIHRMLCHDVVVQGNPKALLNQLAAVLDKLRRIQQGNSVDDELLEAIKLIAITMEGLKGKAMLSEKEMTAQVKPVGAEPGQSYQELSEKSI
jgi:hypothetical protein